MSDRRQSRRIAMVTTRCQPEIGGIESHVAEVARRLTEHGHTLEVLTTDRSGDLPAVESVDGYVVRRYRAFPRRRDWYLSPGLFRALLTGHYSLIHVQGVHTLVPPLAMLAAVLRRIPFVLTFHTGGSSIRWRGRARSTQFRLLAPLLRRARELIGVSIFESRRFESILGYDEGAIRVVRNGGALPSVHLAATPDPDLVVSVGRLERYKGHHRAVEALPHLLERRPGARLEIIGSGPYESELLALAARLGVSERVSVRFIPPVDRAAMAMALSGAGAVVLLSDYEAHPVAVMEALTVGRPVVVSRTSGLTELAEIGWARGVDHDASPAVIAGAILDQLDRPLLPRPADLPTWETCVAVIDETYRDAVGDSQPQPSAGAA